MVDSLDDLDLVRVRNVEVCLVREREVEDECVPLRVREDEDERGPVRMSFTVRLRVVL